MFIHSSIDWHVGYFHLLAIGKNATVNIGIVTDFLKYLFFFPLFLIPVIAPESPAPITSHLEGHFIPSFSHLPAKIKKNKKEKSLMALVILVKKWCKLFEK